MPETREIRVPDRDLLAEGGRTAHEAQFAEAAVVAGWKAFLERVGACAA